MTRAEVLLVSWVPSFYGSTIGKKVAMAATGAVLVGYLIIHALGNLLAWRGPAAINDWAEFLKGNPPLVWGVRGVLLAALVVHVHAALALTRLNRAARPRGYALQQRDASPWTARTLRVGGVILLVFIIYHLLHFTTGTVHPAFSPADVFGNLRIAFEVPWVTAFYLLAMVALGLHLGHGVWSAFQTLGLSHPRWDAVRRGFALGLALLLALAFASIPVAFATGWLQ